MPQDLQQFGPLTGAAITGGAFVWAVVSKVLMPSKMKAFQVEIDALKVQVATLEAKAKKYDELMEGLASAQLSKLEDHG